jgi:hypothetical protein
VIHLRFLNYRILHLLSLLMMIFYFQYYKTNLVHFYWAALSHNRSHDRVSARPPYLSSSSRVDVSSVTSYPLPPHLQLRHSGPAAPQTPPYPRAPRRCPPLTPTAPNPNLDFGSPPSALIRRPARQQHPCCHLAPSTPQLAPPLSPPLAPPPHPLNPTLRQGRSSMGGGGRAVTLP